MMRRVFSKQRDVEGFRAVLMQESGTGTARLAGMGRWRKMLWIGFACAITVCILYTSVSSNGKTSTGHRAEANENGVYVMQNAGHGDGVGSENSNEATVAEGSVQLVGTHVVLEDGTELVYQRAGGERAAGSVLFFHGCHHSSTDYWGPGKGCLECIGLPEEVRMVELTLGRNLNAVAISSTNRRSKCWGTRLNGEGEDYDRVDSCMKYLKEHKIHLENTSLFAVGASSGGSFATSLHTKFDIQGVNAIVAGSVAARVTSEGRKIPRHALTHMAGRDGRTAGAVAESVRWLREHGVAVLERQVHPHALSAEWLAESVKGWDTSVTREVMEGLKAHKLIDEGGELTCDPRMCDWRPAVAHLGTRLNDSFVADRSPLSEQLNRAWAAHESSADFFEDVLDFFMGDGGW